jgi:hypothetical protein
VEGTLEKQMQVLDFSYAVIVRQKERILLTNQDLKEDQPKQEDKEKNTA